MERTQHLNSTTLPATFRPDDTLCQSGAALDDPTLSDISVWPNVPGSRLGSVLRRAFDVIDDVVSLWAFGWLQLQAQAFERGEDGRS